MKTFLIIFCWLKIQLGKLVYEMFLILCNRKPRMRSINISFDKLLNRT